MIESHWEDGKYYVIEFKTEQNIILIRGIVVPLEFPEEKISTMFQSCFKNIEILDVVYEQDLWLAKKYFRKIL